MKILLCSPYDKDLIVPSGGIAVWARNLLAYYSKQSDTNLVLEIEPFDRKTSVKENSSPIYRIIFGIKEYITAYFRVRRRLQTEHFDVIHLTTSAQYGLLRDWLMISLARRFKVRTILHLHFGRVPEIEQTNNIEWKLFSKVARAANGVIAIDQKSYRILQKNGFHSYYLPNPLHEQIIQLIESDGSRIHRDPNKIVFVGHVISTKGIYELVEACKSIKNINLNIIGKYSPEVKERIQLIAGSDTSWLEMRGVMSHTNVIHEMLSAGIFVLPTYTEGFPNVILESMACGCPIVTTDVGAIPEMLDINGGMNNGICVKPKDADGLKLAITKMLNDRGYASTCGANARKRVLELFSMPKVWEKLIEIWEHSIHEE